MSETSPTPDEPEQTTGDEHDEDETTPQDFEDDPARNPDEEELKDIKGG